MEQGSSEQEVARERLFSYPPLHALLTKWHGQITHHLQLFLDWEKRELSLAQKVVLPLFASREFDKTKGLLRARAISAQVQALLVELDTRICSDEDADEFLAYRDAFTWYLSFLEKLHEDRNGAGAGAGADDSGSKSVGVVTSVSDDKDMDEDQSSEINRDIQWLDELKDCVKLASMCLSRIRKYDPWKVFNDPPCRLIFIKPSY